MNKNILKGFILSFLILISLSLVIGVGFHSADEILSGTFSGDYIFTKTLNVQVPGGTNDRGINFYGSEAAIIASNGFYIDLDSNDDYAGNNYLHITGDNRTNVLAVFATNGNVGIGTTNPLSTLDVNGTIRVEQICDEIGNNCKDISAGWSSSISCPAGFTLLESQGRQLGCIQTNEEGKTNYDGAVNDCWNTYGARLPTYSEINIAFNNYALLNEVDDREWVDAAYGGGAATVIREDGLSGGTGEGSSESYRCFIPK